MTLRIYLTASLAIVGAYAVALVAQGCAAVEQAQPARVVHCHPVADAGAE